MKRAPEEEPSLRSPAGDSDAYLALLRREQQLETMQRSLGWRLLSYYGPYKRRYVQPALRTIQRALAQWLRPAAEPSATPYQRWTELSDRCRQAESRCRQPIAGGHAAEGVISLVATVDEATRVHLASAIASVLTQDHEGWELLIAWVGDGESPAPNPLVFPDDVRIRSDPASYANHAVAATAAIARARGAIVGFASPAVTWAPDALSIACGAFATTGCDVLYGDEDRRDELGRRHTPQFKPGWSPDLLLSWMYWSRVVFYRREFLAGLLPLVSDVDAVHEYDLALRATEQRATIAHVPRILAHVADRSGPKGDAHPGRWREGERILAAALERRGIAGSVQWDAPAAAFRVRRTIIEPALVSIVIPTRDGLALLQRCLRAVEATDHPSFEVVIVDNGSSSASTLAFLAATKHKVLRAPGPFNFSRLNNLAVAHTHGRYLVFLNDDTAACDPGWLRALEEQAQRPEVGVVGAKLLYADGRIQHAGIAVGVGGVAGHPGRFGQATIPDGVRNLSAVTAACMMMRRDTFDEIGGFDESLPVNSNDVDLCLKARARGYLVVYTPHAVLHHYESQTRGARARPDDTWLMTRRWRSVLRGDPYYSPNADLDQESGAADLSKPDGLIRLYAGVPIHDAPLRIEAGRSVGQRFFATAPDLSAIVVRAAIGGGDPERALRLVVHEAPSASVDVRVVEQSFVGRTAEERWFCFEPLAESCDRFWYFRLEVMDGHVVTLGRNAVASDVMGPCFEDDVLAHGTLCFELYARAPYRCATTPP